MKIDADKVYTTVGNNIRKYREDKGLSQHQLGSKIGMGRTAIVNIENGKQRATVFVIYSISDVLCISPLDLLPHVDEFIEHTIKTANGLDVTIGAKTFAALQKYRPLLKTTI